MNDLLTNILFALAFFFIIFGSLELRKNNENTEQWQNKTINYFKIDSYTQEKFAQNNDVDTSINTLMEKLNNVIDTLTTNITSYSNLQNIKLGSMSDKLEQDIDKTSKSVNNMKNALNTAYDTIKDQYKTLQGLQSSLNTIDVL
tara:strand:+ start:6771 stop:7202 length:432 start_codon:yes stop_codon:yes gene_type:complete